MKIDKPPYKPFKIVAHRGSGSRFPENTVSAIREAIKLGVDFVEIDVRRTRDGKLALWHDDTMEKLTGNKEKCLEDENYDAVSKIDVGLGEHIPLLERALDAVKDRVGLVVDIKRAGYEEEIYREISERGMVEQTIFTGENESLIRLKEMDSRVIIAYTLYVADPRSIFYAKKIGAMFVNFKFPTVTPEIINRAHENGLGVIVWVVNTPRDLIRYASMNVDVITTDDPREALALRKRLREQRLIVG